MKAPIEFEEIFFSGELERNMFIKWLNEKIAQGYVESVEADSNCLQETRFYRIVGEAQIWALGDPVESDYSRGAGFFRKISPPPTTFEPKTFNTIKEYNEFIEWIESRLAIGSIEEIPRIEFENMYPKPNPEHRYVWGMKEDSSIWVIIPPKPNAPGRFIKRTDMI